MLLGCIGDDFTGSSDIANTLTKGGMAVTQFNGIPNYPAAQDIEAGVISLKSRTAPVQQAIDQSVAAAQWLLEQGCQQLFFKYCSTFDSTTEGNIGPVADALMELLGEQTTLFCPAFPATGRSIYQGHLFVGDVPLHESGMRHHPLTPMVDSDLRRWLGYQTNRAVGHIPYQIVRQGPKAISEFVDSAGQGYFIADAIEDENLLALGAAFSNAKLLTGGSGLALRLPENFRKQGKIGQSNLAWKGIDGPAAILSGSCSIATRGQIAKYGENRPFLEISAESLLEGKHTAESVCEWAMQQAKAPLIYTSADPAVVRAAQDAYGQEFIAGKIEAFFGQLAVELIEQGVKRLVSAGG